MKNRISKIGKNYKLDVDSISIERKTLRGYKTLPPITMENETRFSVDVEDLPRNYYVESRNNYQSKYAIGFEIEKNYINCNDGSVVYDSDRYDTSMIITENRMMRGTETDCSCGVEMVTMPLPLLPNSFWRNKVIDAFWDMERQLDSPADYRCGGHIHLSMHGKTPNELRKLMRIVMPVMYAIHRQRLVNGYCYNDLLMADWNDSRSRALQSWRGRVSKYNAVTNHVHTMELRFPSAVKSTRSLIRRYEIMFILMDYAEQMNGTYDARLWKQMMNKLKPIMSRMYGGNVEKLRETLNYVNHFRKWMISDGTICHEDLRQYIGFRDDDNGNSSADYGTIVDEASVQNYITTQQFYC